MRSVECLRRRIRVRPLPNQAKSLDSADRVWVVFERPAPDQPRELRCKLEEVRVDADDRLMTLTPGVTRDAVALMKGATILVEAQDEAPDDFGLSDLEGLEVRDGNGILLGRVTEVYPSLAGGAFEVRRDDGSTFVLPVIEQVLEDIDMERGIVVVGDIAPYVVEDED